MAIPLQGENCLSQRSAVKITLRSAVLIDGLKLLIMVSIKVYHKCKFMYICRKYLRVSAYIWYSSPFGHLGSLIDTRSPIYHFCHYSRLLLDLQLWSAISYDYCRWRVILCVKAEMHGSIDTRSLSNSRRPFLYQGLSYEGPWMRLGFFFRYLYKDLWMYWKSFI